MLKIRLLNLPFAAVNLPSIGLTQIKSVLQTRFGDQVSVDVIHLNHDFALYLGVDFYQSIADSVGHLVTGLGDWFFRPLAFPELEDNTTQYLRRFYPYRDPQAMDFKEKILEKRAGAAELFDHFIEIYQLTEADIVGFTSMFAQNTASFAMAKRLKQRKPELITLMGGANCEAPMGLEIIKHVPQIDYVFSGPALQSLSGLIEKLLEEKRVEADSIAGILSKTNYRKREMASMLGNLKAAGLYGEDLDINTKVSLDYEPFLQAFTRKIRPASQMIEPMLQFETSRGCWWGERSHCTFCGLNGTGMNYRAMQPAVAIDYLQELFQYADRCNHFVGVDNILPKKYFKEVLPYLNTPPNAGLFYEVKADLSEEDIQALVKARILRMQPGIESLATSTLKLMRKGTSAFQNLRLLQYCTLYNVYPEWNLLVGFPGETQEVYQKYVQDLPLLVHLPPPSGVYPVRFDRFSPYFELANEYQLQLHPMDFYSYIYPVGEQSLRHMAYFFSDHNTGSQYARDMARWLGKMRVQFNLWYDRWYGDSKAIFPMLYFKEDSTVVCDSRSGQVLEHEVGVVGKYLLKYISRAKRVADLVSEPGSLLTSSEVERQVEYLREKGLIFQEGDRVMSLVLPRKPAMNYSTLLSVEVGSEV